MHIPITLPPNSEILVTGAGGGFDVVCALPVALALKEAGHKVHLASFAHTDFDKLDAGLERPLPRLCRVDEHTRPTPETESYCPEIRLAHWWRQQFDEACSVWCYNQIGVKPLSQIYTYLAKRLSLTSIIVVDAGVDGLFQGDEFDDSTPSIDAISILAAWDQKELSTYFSFTAFGTEGREYSVRHVDALERIAELTRLKSFLGATALTLTQSVGQQFRSAVDFVHSTMDKLSYSLMATSMLASLTGRFGETVLTPRTNTAPVWVSPFTSLFWFFELAAVAQSKPYLAEMMQTETVGEVVALFQRYRESHPCKPRRDIPI